MANSAKPVRRLLHRTLAVLPGEALEQSVTVGQPFGFPRGGAAETDRLQACPTNRGILAPRTHAPHNLSEKR